MGDSARVRVASTKISKIEERALRERYGTVHKGVRVAIDRLLQLPTGESLSAAVSAVREDAPTPHRHREWTEISRWYDQGTEYVRKVCTCGFETVDRAK